MLKPLQKVAAFLLILGLERGRSIIALMDNDEIKTIVPEFERLANLSLEIQESVRKDFQHLGYEDKMKPSEALGVIRLLFNGSKINDKEKGKILTSRSFNM
jgi:flagellar motor switch protein FliG